MAVEGKKIGPWRGKDRDIPTLAVLDLCFHFADGRHYGNDESAAACRNADDTHYQPLKKRASQREEEVNPYGFVELQDLRRRSVDSP